MDAVVRVGRLKDSEVVSCCCYDRMRRIASYCYTVFDYFNEMILGGNIYIQLNFH